MKMSSLAKQVALGETKCYCTTVSVTDTQIIIRRKTRVVRKIEKNQSARREGERVDGQKQTKIEWQYVKGQELAINYLS